MPQTKIGSLTESFLNVFIGWSIAVLSQVVIFPLYGIVVPVSTNLKISMWFTVVSVVRSYVVRRWFNGFKSFNSNFES